LQDEADRKRKGLSRLTRLNSLEFGISHKGWSKADALQRITLLLFSITYQIADGSVITSSWSAHGRKAHAANRLCSEVLRQENRDDKIQGYVEECKGAKKFIKVKLLNAFSLFYMAGVTAEA
jgi:hypothetical protein